MEDGSILGCLTSRMKNIPVSTKGAVKATVSYENQEVFKKDAAGVPTTEKITVSNILGIEFHSTLAYVVANAKSVAISADMI